MGEQQQEQEEDHKDLADSNKRKLEDTIELAKQKVQEIASRLVSDADLKRPRINSDYSSDASMLSNSASVPPPFPVSYAAQPIQYHGLQGTNKRISIPNGKVGVVIGKGGETIKYIQLQSGAKIQITKDQDADPHSLTRDVDLMGTSEQISRAEQLINDVITEADAGGSASSAVGFNAKQSEGEQFSMKVPNDRVGLLIGKGGETIKYMQSKSGARIQIIPLHLPPGDTSTERMVYMNGSMEQIEAAKELVNDVISGKRIINPSGPHSYTHPGYPPSGNWAQPGQPPMPQQPQYGYTQPGPYYGNYSTSQQIGWDQSNLSTISPTPQQATGYAYYGQPPQMGSAPLNPSYSYSQASVASSTYDQAYTQQPPSYGQNISIQTSTTEQQKAYATSSYGLTTLPSQPDGASSTQSNQSAPYAPPTYSQQVASSQTYWPSGQPSAQTGYDQTAYSQTAYGGLQPGQNPPSSIQPVYGEGGYPSQPTSAPPNYVQRMHSLAYGQPQLEAQPQSQPPSNGLSQSNIYGADAHDGNSNAGHGSNPAVQEAVSSQS